MPSSPPDDFDWVIPDVLAASGRPHNPRKVLEFFMDEGVDVIITLTTVPLNEALINEFGFEYHHIPVPDFTAPRARQIEKFVSVIRKARRAGKKAVVHCHAGRGRTGTMLACYLVSLRRSAAKAIEEIRKLRPGSVETFEQEQAVKRYALRLGRRLKKK